MIDSSKVMGQFKTGYIENATAGDVTEQSYVN